MAVGTLQLTVVATSFPMLGLDVFRGISIFKKTNLDRNKRTVIERDVPTNAQCNRYDFLITKDRTDLVNVTQ